MMARDAMINLLKMYREYTEYFECDAENDKTIALAIIALEQLKENDEHDSMQ